MKQRFCFTLIELLFVITIIIILAALLLPALTAAKNKAKQAVCANNLKNVGTATMLYAQDQNEWIHAAYDAVSATRYDSALYRNGYLPTLKLGHPCVFICPSLPPHVYMGGNQMYGMRWPEASVGAARYWKLTKISHPEDFLIYVDSVSKTTHAQTFPVYTDNNASTPHCRHSGYTANAWVPCGAVYGWKRNEIVKNGFSYVTIGNAFF